MKRSTEKILTTHVGSLPGAVLEEGAPEYEGKLKGLVDGAALASKTLGY